MKSAGYQVEKIFNNNVILALQNGKERILLAKGIGFGKKTGDMIAAQTSVDKIFSIQNEENLERFRQVLGQISDDTFIICENIIHMISCQLGEELDEKIHINLVDHIAFMLKRIMNGDQINNPFLTEVAILYRQEYEIAKKAVEMLEEQSGLNIPDGEIGFITMHIHSARKSGELSQTIKCAYLANVITEIIEQEQQISIDRESLDYARFVTHVRFTVERLLRNTPITNDLLGTIKRKYKTSYALAKKVGKIIEEQLEIISIPEGELGYITIHIEKLCNK
jgi:transcriptional antiterminator